ncbi:MAG: glutamine-hydrolyzing GMP synthase [Phycisphaerales bacterium]|nr:MAG: glutamine-hydrolyzing GMP synthase [Phycisphaerales bacterium]
MMPQTIAVVDFGSQYAQLIARRVRENNVHSLLCAPHVTPEELQRMNAVGLILSGGPSSVYAENAPRCDPALLETGLPILGICYGMHLACHMLGGEVGETRSREYGRTRLWVDDAGSILAHVPSPTSAWMSHGDVVDRLGGDFDVLAHTESCPFAAVRHKHRPIYGLQFHPEVTHTPSGSHIIRNFVYDVCGCDGSWTAASVTRHTIDDIRRRVGPDERVICGLSGGVDSSVTAALLHEAIADRLVCIFVDNGLMRQGEVDLVEATFREHSHIDLRVVDAADAFLSALDGEGDPQRKRTIIGREFIQAFKSAAAGIEGARFLAQGTLYPDVIESGHSVGGVAANIKLHHNVGALPAELGFELIEPLRDLFKDEVRRIGEHLGLPREIVWRHPFPGPGLAVRIIGPVTRQALELLRRVDEILLEEIHAAGWYGRIAQALAVLLPIRTVGVMGDDRSYAGQHIAAIRLVETTDFMTADWVRIDHNVLADISSRIINEVPGVNRVVYDISSKPPATIEWE